MSLLSYWICANGVMHKGACNCVIRPKIKGGARSLFGFRRRS